MVEANVQHHCCYETPDLPIVDDLRWVFVEFLQQVRADAEEVIFVDVLWRPDCADKADKEGGRIEQAD